MTLYSKKRLKNLFAITSLLEHMIAHSGSLWISAGTFSQVRTLFGISERSSMMSRTSSSKSILPFSKSATIFSSWSTILFPSSMHSLISALSSCKAPAKNPSTKLVAFSLFLSQFYINRIQLFIFLFILNSKYIK